MIQIENFIACNYKYFIIKQNLNKKLIYINVSSYLQK